MTGTPDTGLDHTFSLKEKVGAFLASSAFFAMLASVSDGVRPPYVGWEVEVATGVLLTTTLWLVFVVDPLGRARELAKSEE